MPTLIVEDGTIVAGANSYVNTAMAGDYFESHPDQATWDDAGEDRQTWALYRAARYLEAKYSGRWRGAPVGTIAYTGLGLIQNLSWPRVILTDLGYIFGSGQIDEWEIPKALIEAQCELALRDIQQGNLASDKEPEAFIASKSESVGPISETTTYQQGTPSRVIYPEIELILAPLLATGGMQTPIVRA